MPAASTKGVVREMAMILREWELTDFRNVKSYVSKQLFRADRRDLLNFSEAYHALPAPARGLLWSQRSFGVRRDESLASPNAILIVIYNQMPVGPAQGYADALNVIRGELE